ncbi:hypothetical protein QR665_16810 [Acinetobacter gerneri]|jgi:hypothetical protein|uniref:hypothetical protein n=1 Tax=Acinetobacter gerneri TaxID=202952 RepID=UPI0029368742|nr:hypothetical protein [Acinetobacter gerneri]MDV2441112.1 hypothetical protein [Acinetobacter gerneri]
MNFFIFSKVAVIAFIVGIFLIGFGLIWRFSSKYKSDLWVKNLGKWFIAFGCIAFLNGIMFSINLKAM